MLRQLTPSVLLIPLVIAWVLNFSALSLQAQTTQIDELNELQKRITNTIDKCLPGVLFIDRGSGFCISKDGFVLTNDHVMGSNKEIDVRFALTGKKFRAKLLGKYPEGDLALLKIEKKGSYPFIKLGDSDKLKPGQSTLALGNPFLLGDENEFFRGIPADFHPSVSYGVVSAVFRNTPPRYPDAIMVDTAVNPGNSGGPLVTLDGVVVGINGKIETRFGLSLNSGAGYAVPSSKIMRFLEPLKKAKGRAVSSGQMKGLTVEERISGGKPGLPIKYVSPGSPAYDAGFRGGDRILAIDSYLIRTQSHYDGFLKSYPAGSKIKFKVLRKSGEQTIEATLSQKSNKRPVKLGIKLGTDDNPLQVTRVYENSSADLGGVKVDDILLEFDKVKIEGVIDLIKIVKEKKHGDKVKVKIKRKDKTLELDVEMLSP